jgi:hypothetical protein
MDTVAYRQLTTERLGFHLEVSLFSFSFSVSLSPSSLSPLLSVPRGGCCFDCCGLSVEWPFLSLRSCPSLSLSVLFLFLWVVCRLTRRSCRRHQHNMWPNGAGESAGIQPSMNELWQREFHVKHEEVRTQCTVQSGPRANRAQANKIGCVAIAPIQHTTKLFSYLRREFG